jgi:glycosyltransferase involved in cell wall biosynthesis
MRPSVSAVIPAYNEEESIVATIAAAVEVLEALLDDYEIIVVNDGSTDATASTVRQVMQCYPAVRLISHQTNRGYGSALASGCAAATRELIFITDADKQFNLRELAAFLPALAQAEIVIGYRRPRADPLLRRVYGWGWNKLVNVLFGFTAHDVDCAFKLFSRQVFRQLQIQSTGHTFSPELLVKARRAGFRVRQIQVTHYPRLAGEPKGARPRAIIWALYELARLFVRVHARHGTAAS